MLPSLTYYLIDTHCHLNFKAFNDDAGVTIQRAQQGSVLKMIVVGSDERTSQKAIEIAQRYESVYAAVGYHPIHLNRIDLSKGEDEGILDKMKQMLKEKKVVALGEIGLDFFREPYNKQEQRDFLVKMIDMAMQVKKPVILHCRSVSSGQDGEAMKELLEVLKSYNQLIGVVHCFNGNEREAEFLLGRGWHLGFTGQITYPENEKIRRVVKIVPTDRILVETDSPYLIPRQLHGQRNEPANVKYVAEEIAEIKNMSFEEVVKVTTDNAEKLFDLH